MSLWWRNIQPSLWRFATNPAGPAREVDAAVLGALLSASVAAPMATLGDVQRLLADEEGYLDPLDHDDLHDTLDDLVELGLVESFRDYTAPVASLSDGVRRQEAWALTRKGRIVVRAVRDAVNDLDRALQLPPRLLDAIEGTLSRILDHLDGDGELLAPDLLLVKAHLEQLQSAAGDFYAAVGALVQHDVTDNTVFVASRERILLVLQQFARQTQRSLQRVRRAVDKLRGCGYGSIAERALPGAGVIDVPGQQAWVDENRRRLEGIDAWFAPHGSIERLIDSAAGAIHALLGAIERRFYATSRGSDPGADFRQLARMLHAQPAEAQAHQVFAAAFGLWPARHPASPDADDVAASTPADTGAVCVISLSLQPRDRVSRTAGRERKIPDMSADREAAEAEAAAEMARIGRLAANLATPGAVSLEHFTGLDAEHTALLVKLLEAALDAFDTSKGLGVAVTMGCQLRLRPGQPGKIATVELSEGTLTAPDMRVEVSLGGEPLSAQEGVA
jgi:uncharacterized protein (TIGR02677 family)